MPVTWCNMYGYGWSVHKQQTCLLTHWKSIDLTCCRSRTWEVRPSVRKRPDSVHGHCTSTTLWDDKSWPTTEQSKRFVKPLDCNRFCPDGSSSFRRWPEPRNWPQHWADPWMHNFQETFHWIMLHDFMICASLQFCDQLADTYRNMLRFDPLNRTHHYSCLLVCQTTWPGTGSDLSRCRSSRKQLPAMVHFGSKAPQLQKSPCCRREKVKNTRVTSEGA